MGMQPGTFTVQPPSWIPRRGDQVRVTQTECPELARRTGTTGPHIVEGQIEQSYLRPGDMPYVEVSGHGYLALENRGVDAVIERI
jgi:hypothetical protein